MICKPGMARYTNRYFDVLRLGWGNRRSPRRDPLDVVLSAFNNAGLIVCHEEQTGETTDGIFRTGMWRYFSVSCACNDSAGSLSKHDLDRAYRAFAADYCAL